MRTRVLNLLLAALLAVAAARLWTAQRAPLPQVPAPGTGAVGAGSAGQGTAAEAGSEAAPAAVTDGYDVIAARDLFSPARGVVPPAAPAAAKPPPKAVPPPKLTLTGVVILDGEKTAFLHEGTAEARPRKVREGDSFAGGTVKTIRPDGITFAFGGSETTVPLRTPKDAGPAPRPGDTAGVPTQPGVVPRRLAQPGVADGTGQLRRPPQTTPGVPRLLPAPDEEPFYEDDIMLEDEDGLLIDDADMIDEDEFPPEDFEEPLE